MRQYIYIVLQEFPLVSVPETRPAVSFRLIVVSFEILYCIVYKLSRLIILLGLRHETDDRPVSYFPLEK